MPKEQEETGPAFHHHAAAELPTYEGGGLWARLIAGEAFGTKAPVKTFSPLFYVHWRLDAGAKAPFEVDARLDGVRHAWLEQYGVARHDVAHGQPG